MYNHWRSERSHRSRREPFYLLNLLIDTIQKGVYFAVRCEHARSFSDRLPKEGAHTIVCKLLRGSIGKEPQSPVQNASLRFTIGGCVLGRFALLLEGIPDFVL
jgi:hypothetical protein